MNELLTYYLRFYRRERHIEPCPSTLLNNETFEQVLFLGEGKNRPEFCVHSQIVLHRY